MWHWVIYVSRSPPAAAPVRPRLISRRHVHHHHHYHYQSLIPTHSSPTRHHQRRYISSRTTALYTAHNGNCTWHCSICKETGTLSGGQVRFGIHTSRSTRCHCFVPHPTLPTFTLFPHAALPTCRGYGAQLPTLNTRSLSVREPSLIAFPNHHSLPENQR